MTSDSSENPTGQPIQQDQNMQQAPQGQPAPYGQPIQQPAPAQYGAPTSYGQPAPYSQQGFPGAPAADPGKTMAIIAVILPFIGLGLVGLILGLVAKSKSKRAGFKNTVAVVAIIISILAIIGTIIAAIFIGIYLADVATQVQACLNGAQTVTVNGQLIDCSTVNK